MILRRLAALSTALLLLRLNVVAVDVTCAEHETAAATSSEHVGNHDHALTTAAADDDALADASDACEVPVRSECCQALASCSVAFDFGTIADDATVPQQQAVAALGTDQPESRRDAPDPPPPKA